MFHNSFSTHRLQTFTDFLNNYILRNAKIHTVHVNSALVSIRIQISIATCPN